MSNEINDLREECYRLAILAETDDIQKTAQDIFNYVKSDDKVSKRDIDILLICVELTIRQMLIKISSGAFEWRNIDFDITDNIYKFICGE